MNLGKVAITFFAFAVVLGLAYALTFFGARGGSYEPDENYDSHVLLEKLEKSRMHAAQGRYRDADDAVKDLREKYGL